MCGARRLSYAELDAMANRLANGLREHGLTRGDRVVVHLDNSVEAVVSLFAVLKAGGVCVPIDPRYPPARVALMLADAGPDVVLAERRTRDRLPPAILGTALWLDDDSSRIYLTWLLAAEGAGTGNERDAPASALETGKYACAAGPAGTLKLEIRSASDYADRDVQPSDNHVEAPFEWQIGIRGQIPPRSPDWVRRGVRCEKVVQP